MAARLPAERPTSFTMACELLSRFVRSGGAGAAGFAGLSLGAKVDAPATMKLLPGAEADEKGKETMELFPQTAGFAERQPERQQLTIFYKGKVLVFDDFPEEKAKELMQLASVGAAKEQSSADVSNPAIQTQISQSMPAAAGPLDAAAPLPMKRPSSDLPIMRKQSLHRFLEKRKDRINARAPYQATSSSPVDHAEGKKKQEERQPWLAEAAAAAATQPAKMLINLNADSCC